MRVDKILQAAVRRALRYLDEIETRRVGPAAEAVDGLAYFQKPLQDAPMDPLAVLAELDEHPAPWPGGALCCKSGKRRPLGGARFRSREERIGHEKRRGHP